MKKYLRYVLIRSHISASTVDNFPSEIQSRILDFVFYFIIFSKLSKFCLKYDFLIL